MASPNGEVAFFVPSFQCLLSPFASSLLSLARGLQVCVCVFFFCRYPQLFGFYHFMTLIKYSIFIVQKKNQI